MKLSEVGLLLWAAMLVVLVDGGRIPIPPVVNANVKYNIQKQTNVKTIDLSKVDNEKWVNIRKTSQQNPTKLAPNRPAQQSSLLQVTGRIKSVRAFYFKDYGWMLEESPGTGLPVSTPVGPRTSRWCAQGTTNNYQYVRVGWNRLLVAVKNAIKNEIKSQLRDLLLDEVMDRLTVATCVFYCDARADNVNFAAIASTGVVYAVQNELDCVCGQRLLRGETFVTERPAAHNDLHQQRELVTDQETEEVATLCEGLVLYVYDVLQIGGDFADFGLDTFDLEVCLACLDFFEAMESAAADSEPTSAELPSTASSAVADNAPPPVAESPTTSDSSAATDNKAPPPENKAPATSIASAPSSWTAQTLLVSGVAMWAAALL